MIWFYDHEDRIIKVSLRAFHDHIDVSEIAKTYAGGGHRKAAGFTLPGDALVDDIFDPEPDPTEAEEELELLKLSEGATEEAQNTEVFEDTVSSHDSTVVKEEDTSDTPDDSS